MRYGGKKTLRTRSETLYKQENLLNVVIVTGKKQINNAIVGVV
jgi:hypothetical protein